MGDCFLEFAFFLFKSAITFYLILCLIYTIFYIRKHIRIGVRILYRTPIKLYPILIIIFINLILNNNSEKSIYHNLTNITGLGSSEAKLICKKFGSQGKSTLKDLENTDLEQLKTYLVNNYVLDNLLTQKVNKYVKKKN